MSIKSKSLVATLLVLAICVLSSVVSAHHFLPGQAPPEPEQSNNNTKKIGIFLESPGLYKLKQTAISLDKTKKLFPQFSTLHYDTTSFALSIYKMQHQISYYQPASYEDILNVSKGLKCDYAIYIMISNSPPRIWADQNSVCYRAIVKVDVRFFDVNTGQIIASREYITEGYSKDVYSSNPSFFNAYDIALDKALEEFSISVAKLGLHR